MKSNKAIVWAVGFVLIMTMIIPGTLALSATATSSGNGSASAAGSVGKESPESESSRVKILSAEKNTEECTCGTETGIHDTDCPLYTKHTDGSQDISLSETAQAYMDRIGALMSALTALDPAADDYQDQLESVNAQMSRIAEDATNDFDEGLITEEEYMTVYTALEELNAIIGGAERGEALGTGSVTCSIENANVAYVIFDKNTDTSTIRFTDVNDGDTVSVDTSVNRNKGLIFFVKPGASSLLTDMTLAWSGGSTAVDLYSIDVPAKDSKFSYISQNSAVGQKILDAAKEEGYVGYFGYTMYESSSFNQNLTVKAEKPNINVSVTADPNKDVRPGTEIRYTVVITPDKTNAKNAKVEKVSLKELKLNGDSIDVKNLTLSKNADGTYTVEIPHTVTMEEWINSLADISVTAELDYSYSLNLKDTGDTSSTAVTHAKVEGTASTQCTFETKKGVIYQLNYDAPEGIQPPEGIPAVPNDETTYFIDDNVVVKSYDRADVDDPGNNGTWKFSGWYIGDDRETPYDEGNSLTMGSNNILLVGIWKFEKYPYADLKIIKAGWEKIDENQSFVFSIRGADDNTKEISNTAVIHGNGTVILKNLPVGRYTVTEDTSWSWRYNPEVKDKTVEITSSSKGDSIVTVNFNNKRVEKKWLNGSSWCRNVFKPDGIDNSDKTVTRDK